MNRQQRWQQKQRDNGCCVICGKKAYSTSVVCLLCLEKRREYNRKRQGYKGTKRGRPRTPEETQ